MHPGRALRLQHLQDNIGRAQKLLKDTEDAFLVEDVPRRRARLEMDIKQLKGLVEEYVEEHRQLTAESAGDAQLVPLGRSLDALAGRIQQLSGRIESLADQHSIVSARLMQQLGILQSE